MYISLDKPEDVNAEILRIKTVGKRSVPVIVITPQEPKANAPAVLWLHGGGYFAGLKEMVYMSRAIDLVRAFGAVVVAPGYTLSIMKPYPAAVEDSYAALKWLDLNASRYGADANTIIVGGESAGGGLAAAVCMMARDRGEVKVALQLPLYPMIDNLETASSRDNRGKIWNSRRNRFGWRMYLRKNAKGEVEPYAAPARQKDYRNLPPCYTFVGSGEPFYTETLTFVENLKSAGVYAEADIYDTDIHSFDMLYPELDISVKARERFIEKVSAVISERN
ncbi:MAG: alpha/beta hydrolase [Oscillospiraceae bacterium]|nr:alpha/beta hydrolase [Oscillospiraceae bacterium]